MRVRGEETRHAILRAAEKVFGERGYAGARMDDVANAVGIRRASLVYYFRDKRALYLALIDDLFGDLMRRYEEILATPGPVRERIIRCLDAWTGHVLERPGLLQITLWEMAPERPDVGRPLAPHIGRVLSAIGSTVVVGQHEGTFRAVDPTTFVLMVAGATAFLTLGFPAFGPDGSSLKEERLRFELRGLVKRLLFTD